MYIYFRERIGSLKTETGQITDDEEEMSSISNKYLTLYLLEELNIMPSAEQVYVGGEEDRLTTFINRNIVCYVIY